jgi:transposase InsO family protein
VPVVNEDAELATAILRLRSSEFSMGSRKTTRRLKELGWQVNHKRVARVWQMLGLNKNASNTGKKRVGTSVNACHVKQAEYANHVWTWDFIFDQTEDGVPLKWLSITDEYTRVCLALIPARRFDHREVIRVLTWLMRTHGVKPKYVRSDNGPEFIAGKLRAWLATLGSEVIYIEPGSPWQNGYAESFHAQARREFFNRHIFRDIADARSSGRRYQMHWNDVRPHGALKMMTPTQFAVNCSLKAA